MKILIACGGTAGHIFPGLALAEALKKEDNRNQVVVVVCDQPRDKRYLRAFGRLLDQIRIETVTAVPLPYQRSLRFIYAAAKMCWAIFQSLKIMLRYTPQVVVGFGGSASFAPLIAARLLGRPVLVHEQNVSPGRANLLLAKIADRIATSFADTDNFILSRPKNRAFQGADNKWPLKYSASGTSGFSLRSFITCRYPAQKIVHTGMPLRPEISAYAAERFVPHSDKFTLFVVGGSQGAQQINKLVLDCLGEMSKEERRHLRVIHLAGKIDQSYVQARYQAMEMESCVFDFLEDIAGAYKLADLLICRGGAGTIFEAAAFGLPSVFIPHPYGTAHQKENAEFLKRRGAALVLDEKTQDCGDLRQLLQRLIQDGELRQALARKIKVLSAPQATDNLKEQVKLLYTQRYVHK